MTDYTLVPWPIIDTNKHGRLTCVWKSLKKEKKKWWRPFLCFPSQHQQFPSSFASPRLQLCGQKKNSDMAVFLSDAVSVVVHSDTLHGMKQSVVDPDTYICWVPQIFPFDYLIWSNKLTFSVMWSCAPCCDRFRRPTAKYCSVGVNLCCIVKLDRLLLQCDDHSTIKANIKIGYGKIQKLAITVVH